MKINYAIATILSIGLITGCNQKKERAGSSPSDAEKKIEPVGLIQPQAKRDTLKGSIKAIATGKIGNTAITINYHSPAVRGRVIWGGLVPFDQVWVTGAHRATSVEFSGLLKIGGVELPPGHYALFTIPGKTNWTIILNKNWNQHLADDYTEKEDLVRIKVKPEIVKANQERLRYVIEPDAADSGKIIIAWEMVKVSVPIEEMK